MTVYFIRNKKTKKPLGFSYSSNDGADYCCSVSFEFEENSDNIWTTTSENIALKVLENDPEWYNADYNSPSWKHIKNMKDFEVGSVNI
jgi:hypothetical protein